LAISVTCPKCSHSLKVKDELAGKRGKCPKCDATMPIPAAPAAAATPTSQAASQPAAASSSTEPGEQILGAFQGTFHPPAVSLVRKLATWLVLAVLLGLVLVYVAILAGLAWVAFWLATSDIPQIPPAAVSLAMTAAIILLLCLLRPVLMPRERPLVSLTLLPDKQRLLVDFLAKVAEQIGSPSPRHIEAECSTRLAADARGQTLTIGLPLFTSLSAEEFAGLAAAQLAPHRRRAGCGPANLIRAINGWMWRSVFQEDRFDRWISRVNLRPGFHLGRLVLPLRALSFPHRAALWVPMFIGNTVAAWLARESELDADRCAARLVGSKCWATLMDRKKVLDFTWEGIASELAFLYREQQLPDSLPHHLAERMADVTPELAATLIQTVIKEEEIPFDSRPTDADRRAAIAAEPAIGVFSSVLPADVLLAECTRLSRAVTFDYYAGLFGAQLVKPALRQMQLPGDPPPLVRRFGKVKT
jgi:hypothetical protein